MNKPFLFLSLTSLLIVNVFNPFTDLGAAEVWNSQKKRNVTTEKRTLYNAPKNSRVGKGSTSLFNRRNHNSTKSGTSNLAQRIQGYRQINVTQERPSILWKLLSPEALASKQADVNIALQNEYKRKKETAKAVVAAMKEYEVHRLKKQREHEEKVEKYEADREQYKKDLEAERVQAFEEAKAVSVSNQPSKDADNRKVNATESRQVLKGTAKLFNSQRK